MILDAHIHYSKALAEQSAAPFVAPCVVDDDDKQGESIQRDKTITTTSSGREFWGLTSVFSDEQAKLLGRVARLTLNATGFGLAMSALVLSGGTGIPIVAVTGLAAVIAAGDVCCTLYNRWHQNPKTGYDDVINLAVSSLLQRIGYEEKHAVARGLEVSRAIRMGVGVSVILVCGLTSFSNLPEGVAALQAKVTCGISSLTSLLNTYVDMDNYKKEWQAIYSPVSLLATVTNSLPATDTHRMAEQNSKTKRMEQQEQNLEALELQIVKLIVAFLQSFSENQLMAEESAHLATPAA